MLAEKYIDEVIRDRKAWERAFIKKESSFTCERRNMTTTHGCHNPRIEWNKSTICCPIQDPLIIALQKRLEKIEHCSFLESSMRSKQEMPTAILSRRHQINNSTNKTFFSLLSANFIEYEILCRKRIKREQVRLRRQLHRNFVRKFTSVIENEEFRYRFEMLKQYLRELGQLISKCKRQ